MKPLGRKAFGSIPHLPNSRVGPGDYHCHEGQARIACEKARDKHDRIIVSEKLDGSNVAVAKHQGQVLALGRSGHLAQGSQHEPIQLFADYVRRRWQTFDAILDEGERINGEWMAAAVGTVYQGLDDPFVAFGMMQEATHLPNDTWRAKLAPYDVSTVHVIHDGSPISVEAALDLLGTCGAHGALEPVEGAVWRVERKGVFDFQAKFVHHDKQDGKYFPENNGGEWMWHWRPESPPPPTPTCPDAMARGGA